MTEAFIAVDWGTSSFRAYRVTSSGEVRERRETAGGILSVKDGAFDAALEAAIGDWPVNLPVIACGMITSRQGWVEVPYVSCPAGAGELSSSLVHLRSARLRALYFVPGLMRRSADGVPDVMRGEEVQVIGAAASGVEHFVAPGTHSKWVAASSGAITGFSTYMTGEVFALLRQHSILARLMSGNEPVADAFDDGVRRALKDPAGLLHQLFSARSLPLFSELPETEVASYLSGLVIGSEVGHAAASVAPGSVFTLLASPQLGQFYARALQLAGLSSKAAADDIVVAGLTRIMHSRGLLA